MVAYRKPPVFMNPQDCPQAGKERMILQQAIHNFSGDPDPEPSLLKRMRDTGAVFMMGQNPALPAMPPKPTLLDFFHYRFNDITFMHLLQSAKLALDAGLSETVIMACMLHDISNGALMRADHGYWGAQLIAPYVSEEVAWAVRYHQALRYYPDESVGYTYPEAYYSFYGRDYQPSEYIRQAYEEARNHRWYMTSRHITINDVYSFKEGWAIDPEIFTDIIGRNFKQPAEGLGFDNSPTAHMWRTMIWPNNFL